MIYCCRQQERTAFRVKASAHRPPGGSLLIFMFPENCTLLSKLPSSLGISKSPEFRPAGTSRLLVVYRIINLGMASASDWPGFCILT